MSAKGIGAGVIAGILGAAIWAAVSYYARVEIGYLAWGIGALVGIAVTYSGSTGPVAGGLAVVITALSLLAGKYMAVEFDIQHALSELDTNVSEELVISYLADEICTEREAKGQEINWPTSLDDSEPDSQEDYPADIWKQAENTWSGLSPDEQQERRDTAEENMQAMLVFFTNQVRQDGFLGSFSAFDLLFFGLGVATAFGIPNQAEGA